MWPNGWRASGWLRWHSSNAGQHTTDPALSGLSFAWIIDLELGNKADLAEIGRAKYSATVGRPAANIVVKNDNDLPKHNTQKEIAKAAGVSTGMVAAKLANMPAHRPANNSANLQTSQSDAAEMLNVSTRTVAAAWAGRRNLSDYQRGVLALRMKPIIEKRALAAMLEGKNQHSSPSPKSDEATHDIFTGEAKPVAPASPIAPPFAPIPPHQRLHAVRARSHRQGSGR